MSVKFSCPTTTWSWYSVYEIKQTKHFSFIALNEIYRHTHTHTKDVLVVWSNNENFQPEKKIPSFYIIIIIIKVLKKMSNSCVFECVKTFWPTTTTFSYIIILLFFIRILLLWIFFPILEPIVCLFVFFWCWEKIFIFFVSVWVANKLDWRNENWKCHLSQLHTVCVCIYSNWI